jgi:hypothetical protein
MSEKLTGIENGFYTGIGDGMTLRTLEPPEDPKWGTSKQSVYFSGVFPQIHAYLSDIVMK